MDGSVDTLCALHPDRPADAGTCERCGNFMCGECRADEAVSALCTPCWRRGHDSRMVGHVRVFAVVLMIHGALVFVAGLFALVYGASLFFSFGSMPAPTGGRAEQVRAIETTVVVVMLVEAIIHLAAGALQALAGWRIRSYRSRGLAVGSLLLGLLTVAGCYCGPTAMAVLIWGLIVLLHADVAARFAAASRSAT